MEEEKQKEPERIVPLFTLMGFRFAPHEEDLICVHSLPTQPIRIEILPPTNGES